MTRPRSSRLLLSPLWLLVALLTTLGLNASSAAASAGPETRVRAIPTATAQAVGQSSSETPASVGCLRPPDTAIASGSCVATKAAEPAGPGPRGGDSPAAARGRQAHADANYGPGFQYEFTLPSGRRVDGINFDTRTVVELKPNNQRAIRAGERQVGGYVDELNTEFPGSTPWTGRVETYDP